jgi:hypothetical protein
MRVELAGGGIIDMGATETAPTIGITDYSRRVTDDFGVTTVVERGFSRQMSTKMLIPFAGADALQRQLADLRATAALWVADDDIASLAVNGFYKDFEIDLNVPPNSYCTLTVEGLTATEPLVDSGSDPSPIGEPSTLRLLQPVVITDAVLVSSSVPENDAAEWSAGVTYAGGYHVIKATTHRVYTSAANGNIGHDPAGTSGLWTDIGPTNRWAMFDQALGSATSAPASISVTLAAGAVDGVALLDCTGATVRVQAPGYDQTKAIVGTGVTFLDLPGADGQVTVTISGPGSVTVGTLLVGKLVGLGVTEASPTAAITDYSRKDVDDFGAVTIVKRAWAKRMTANALISTSSVDDVMSRMVAVRARPSLWIGQDGVETLTIYGFFKDFSIEVSENVSKLSLSIEGLSDASKLKGLDLSVEWPDVGNSAGTKPDDNATVGAPNGTPVGNKVAEEVAAAVDQVTSLRDEFDAFPASIGAIIDQAKSEAILAASDALDKNPTFSVWPNASAPPSLWEWWDASAGIRRDTGMQGRPYAAAFDVPAGQNAGISQAVTSTFGSYVIEVTGRATNWNGAGILVQYFNPDGSYYGEARINCGAEKDNSGWLSNVDGGNGTYQRTWSKMFSTNIDGNIRSFRVYVMANWDGFEGVQPPYNQTIHRDAKSISFDSVIFRKATQPEIDAGAALAGLGNKASVQQLTEAIVGEQGARATAIQNISVSYNGQQLTLQQLSGVIADVSGRTRGFWGVSFNGGTPVLSAYYIDDNGNVQQGVVIGGNLYVQGDAIIAGSLRVAKLFRQDLSQMGRDADGSTFRVSGLGNAGLHPSFQIALPNCDCSQTSVVELVIHQSNYASWPVGGQPVYDGAVRIRIAYPNGEYEDKDIGNYFERFMKFTIPAGKGVGTVYVQAAVFNGSTNITQGSGTPSDPYIQYVSVENGITYIDVDATWRFIG